MPETGGREPVRLSRCKKFPTFLHRPLLTVQSLYGLPRGNCHAISPSTVCKLTVSGSFHSPNRGTFHLSLTVLVHYRSSNVFSLREWTPQIPTGLACPVVLRYPTRVSTFSCTGLSPSVVGFSIPILLTSQFVTLNRQTLQPRPSKLDRFRLFPVRSPLLGEFYLFLMVLRCFSSHGSLHTSIYSTHDAGGSHQQVSLFGHPRIYRLFTAPRGLSQCPTSFIGI